VVFGQDTDLNLSEKEFEAEFNKLYNNKKEEARAAAALAAAEKQVRESESITTCTKCPGTDVIILFKKLSQKFDERMAFFCSDYC
jgi:hypothetical protein